MAFTQADIDELKAKIKAFAGVKNTTFADQSTTFDLEGAKATLAMMEADVAGRVSRTRYAATSKGI